MVNVIKSGLVDLENKIEEMSEHEIENERLYGIMNTVKDILLKIKPRRARAKNNTSTSKA